MEFSIVTPCFKYELNQENFYDYQACTTLVWLTLKKIKIAYQESIINYCDYCSSCYLFLFDLLVCVMHFVYTLRKNCAFYADVDKTVVTDQCG